MKFTKRLILLPVVAALLPMFAACGDTGGEPAAKSAVETLPTPQGRILTANQASNTISIIDVATDTAYGTVGTGQQPHHVVGTPDGKEFWVSLYGENRVQVFDAVTLKEIASVDVGAVNDDLTFDPDGKRIYVSLGKNDAVAVVDVADKKLLQTVPVGKAPHGVKVTPDGKTAGCDEHGGQHGFGTQPAAGSEGNVYHQDGGEPIRGGDREGQQHGLREQLPGRLAVGGGPGGGQDDRLYQERQAARHDFTHAGERRRDKLWIANTGSAEVWLVDAATRKLITRVPAGQGTHGTALTPSGKLYVTNTNDSTVTVIDTTTQKVVTTIPVGSNPNGLTYMAAPK